MKKFILVIFGDFSSYQICKDIALSLTPIVDSPNLKFQHSKGSMIFHFASEISQEELDDFITGVLIDFSESFILLEFNDKLTLNLPKEIKEHLLNIDEEDEDDDYIKFNWNDFSEEINEDEFAKQMIKEIKRNIKRPTLDELLDKIKEVGITNLTPFEKEVLDEYSKN